VNHAILVATHSLTVESEVRRATKLGLDEKLVIPALIKVVQNKSNFKETIDILICAWAVTALGLLDPAAQTSPLLKALLKHPELLVSSEAKVILDGKVKKR